MTQTQASNIGGQCQLSYAIKTNGTCSSFSFNSN